MYIISVVIIALLIIFREKLFGWEQNYVAPTILVIMILWLFIFFIPGLGGVCNNNPKQFSVIETAQEFDFTMDLSTEEREKATLIRQSGGKFQFQKLKSAEIKIMDWYWWPFGLTIGSEEKWVVVPFGDGK